jgi:hypothetical protein
LSQVLLGGSQQERSREVRKDATYDNLDPVAWPCLLLRYQVGAVLRDSVGKGHQTSLQSFKSALKVRNVGVNNSGETEGRHDGKGW